MLATTPLSAHTSIPARANGGPPHSAESTAVAAPPARSGPSGARVPPFARAPESRPAIDLAARRRDRIDRGRPAPGGAIGPPHPAQLPDPNLETATTPPHPRTPPAPPPTRHPSRRQPPPHP